MAEHGKKTILLVEDEPIIAMAEKKLLEKYGYAVIVAPSGEKAVETVGGTPGIDLILMDINLGNGMDGTEAAVRILASRDLPLIFLSSHTEREVVEKTEGITSYGYIVKNSGETVLIASIKMAFRLFDATTKLRDREEHYQSLFDNTGDQVWIEDFSAFKRRVEELRDAGFTDFRSWLSDHPESLYDFADLVRIVDLNQKALESIVGAGCGERHPTLRALLGPESRDFFAEELSALAEGRLNFETETYIAEKSGELKAHHLSVNVISGHEEDLSRVHVVLHDLSEIRRAEAALAAKARLQRLLVDLSSLYINLSPESIDSAIDSSLGKIAQAVGADRAYIFAYDLSAGIGRNTHEWCAPGIEPRIRTLQALALENIREAIDLHQRGRPHFIPDLSLLPIGSMRYILDPQGIKSLLTVPLMDGGRCVGSVGFDSVQRTYAYSENERDVLTVFAQMLVNIEHRKQAAQELARDRAELKAIQDNTPVMMCVLDGKQRVLYANPAFTSFTGLSEAELKGGRAFRIQLPRLRPQPSPDRHVPNRNRTPECGLPDRIP